MNRREVLKNLGLGAGFLIIGPSTLSLLQSCQSEPSYNWKPVFLSAQNGYILKEVLNVILPKTDTPGANDLNISEFIDSYMNEVAPIEQGKKFQRSADAFARAFKREYDEEPENGTAEQYEKLVAKYLRAAPEDRAKYAKKTGETQDPQDKDPNLEDEMDADAGSFQYLTTVRDMGIWAWKTSEQVGENVLWYDPIPGEYIPCGSVDELGNGKAMSL